MVGKVNTPELTDIAEPRVPACAPVYVLQAVIGLVVPVNELVKYQLEA